MKFLTFQELLEVVHKKHSERRPLGSLQSVDELLNLGWNSAADWNTCRGRTHLKSNTKLSTVALSGAHVTEAERQPEFIPLLLLWNPKTSLSVFFFNLHESGLEWAINRAAAERDTRRGTPDELWEQIALWLRLILNPAVTDWGAWRRWGEMKPECWDVGANTASIWHDVRWNPAEAGGEGEFHSYRSVRWWFLSSSNHRQKQHL